MKPEYHILKTSTGMFKKQATYPEDDHTVYKPEYWDHPRYLHFSVNNFVLLDDLRDQNYNVPTPMYVNTFYIRHTRLVVQLQELIGIRAVAKKYEMPVTTLYGKM